SRREERRKKEEKFSYLGEKEEGRMRGGKRETRRLGTISPNYQLPITNYQLPITNYQLPITNYQLTLNISTNFEFPQ
ncbi:hypothetical protein PN499_00070, partial [Kamptonema animale CS-326]|nr:hypothetical protein [Kamptonema animale CS-326]